MGDRSLRGMRLGAQSMETEDGVLPAPRKKAEYISKDNERIFVTFAENADVPKIWKTKKGKKVFLISDNSDNTNYCYNHDAVNFYHKSTRTHWDMLLERRSIDELEKVLETRIQYLENIKNKQ